MLGKENYKSSRNLKQRVPYFIRNLVVWIEKRIYISQLVPVLFCVFRSPDNGTGNYSSNNLILTLAIHNSFHLIFANFHAKFEIIDCLV